MNETPNEVRRAGWDAFQAAIEGGYDSPQVYAQTLEAIISAFTAGRVVVDLPADSDVDVYPIKYDVSILPRDDINRSAWSITVAARGNSLYAVLLRDHWCLSRDGSWGSEPIPSERDDEWKSTHRFELGEALALAVEHAPHVKCNGKTAVELLEWLRVRETTGGVGGGTQ